MYSKRIRGCKGTLKRDKLVRLQAFPPSRNTHALKDTKVQGCTPKRWRSEASVLHAFKVHSCFQRVNSYLCRRSVLKLQDLWLHYVLKRKDEDSFFFIVPCAPRLRASWVCHALYQKNEYSCFMSACCVQGGKFFKLEECAHSPEVC